ncbi:hypothetical protein FQN54_000581 [Arachnomyces sp. PD_36]|nr:hypothetical protein FQN54_000581 [Arachnomyces sp. PD_36]
MMKNWLSCFLLLSTSAMPALGHWNYNRLVVDGMAIGEPYEYVRRTNNSYDPLQNVNSTDMRCNSGGASGADTKTWTVEAGSQVGFTIQETFGHPGPQQVYLSKAPGHAADYDGSGGWARIYSLTTTNYTDGDDEGNLYWATDDMLAFQFTLPAQTPPGEYLLRAEGLALHAAHKKDQAQFYIGCAQINVTGEGTGTPGPLVEFPGAYKWDTPGVFLDGFWSLITDYTAPGPELWPEGNREYHSVNASWPMEV